MERISSHISYKEAIRSSTASKYGIDNNPNPWQLENMKAWAKHIFEPLRLWVGGAIRINSFFRSPEVNKKVGGSKTSSHMKGQAGDIDDTHQYKTNKEMFYYIKENLSFDQLIWEFGDDENPDWIHVSYVSHLENRCQVLRAIRFTDRGGRRRVKYIPYV